MTTTMIIRGNTDEAEIEVWHNDDGTVTIWAGIFAEGHSWPILKNGTPVEALAFATMLVRDVQKQVPEPPDPEPFCACGHSASEHNDPGYTYGCSADGCACTRRLAG